MRKYIVDSCLYWPEYHVDGFRFDLMALEDAETMNAVRAALDALPGGRDILMYGEPWTGGGHLHGYGGQTVGQGGAGCAGPAHRIFLRCHPGRHQGRRV